MTPEETTEKIEALIDEVIVNLKRRGGVMNEPELRISLWWFSGQQCRVLAEFYGFKPQKLEVK